MKLQTIVEIPKNSQYKYEEKDGKLVLDRVLNQKIPENYGYIPGTLAKDGDPLDVFIASNSPLQPLSEVTVQIIAAFKCIDSGVSDDKLIGILDEDNTSIQIESIKHYLETYKKDFKIVEFVGESEAIEIYMENKL